MVESGASRGGDGESGAAKAQAIASTHESGPGDGASPDAELDVLVVGAKVGRYLVVERLGAGAMGVVYAAYDPKLDRKIALKLLRPQEGKGDHARRTARLEREAQAIAKLSHPNVVGIFDVGVHEGQVFMAMEYLAGGTLSEWVAAKKRTWRDIVKMFIEVGHGLAGAHAEGLIHRDFKPDNVLLDKNGVPKVVDFGLVRLTARSVDITASGNAADEEGSREGKNAPGSVALAAGQGASLTRTGALTGTPAYMAPEQFLGKAVDARTDQFAFCVALHEALYGERPFEGSTLIALSESTTSGQIKSIAAATQVPSWLRKAVVRGLDPSPANRHQSLDDLVTLLSRDPEARRRRIIIAAVAVALVVAGAFVVQRRLHEQKRALDRNIDERLLAATKATNEAGREEEQALELRQKAFLKFDRGLSRDGEQIWAKVREELTKTDQLLERADHFVQSALDMDPARIKVRDSLADVLLRRALLAEMSYRKADTAALVNRLQALGPDTPAIASWRGPGTVRWTSDPPTAQVMLETATTGPSGVIHFHAVKGAASPPPTVTMEAGTYRFVARVANRDPVFYPIQISRRDDVGLVLEVPSSDSVPPGFVYVPAGQVLDGDSDELLRTTFLNAAPLHGVPVKSFLIARHETTYADWISFLESQPAAKAKALGPSLKSDRGTVVLTRPSTHGWTLELSIAGVTTKAPFSVPLRFPARTVRSAQNWANFPVTGISADDAADYTAWLRRSGRLPTARFCTALEWERAARGADDRVYPHGYQIDADDANIDVTYGRKPGAFGPDEVGSHPRSDSPFGVSDLAGNAMELVEGDDHQLFIMGGGYYHDAKTALLTNREPADRTLRFHTVGFRVCADAKE